MKRCVIAMAVVAILAGSARAGDPNPLQVICEAAGGCSQSSANVVSPSGKLTTLASAYVDEFGNVLSQDGTWISSVNFDGNGNYILYFASGIFSAAPNCTVTLDNRNNGGVRAFRSSTASIQIQLDGLSASAFQIICVGAK